MTSTNSGKITVKVNRPTINSTQANTTITIFKGKNELTAVNATPTDNQYQVSITSTKNCTCKLENDYKTITVLTVTSTSAEINISINVENKKTYTKVISVAAITDIEVIKGMATKYEQLANKFSWIVRGGTSSSNMELTESALNVIAKNIDLTGKVTFSSLDTTTQSKINSASIKSNNASSILDANTTNWINAYNRVAEWASGAITDHTTINGGMLSANTVTAEKIAIGDFTNYCILPYNKTNVGGPNNSKCNAYYIESGTGGLHGSSISNKITSIKSGDKFRVTGVMWSETASKGVSIVCCMRDNTEKLITSSKVIYNVTTASTYEEFSLELTVPNKPTGFAYMDFKIQLTDTTCPIWIYSLGIYKMASGELIVNGAIDGKTITGATLIGGTFRNQNNTFSVDSEGNIVGAQIQGSEVIGDSFSVEGELTADTITANKINGGRYPGTLEDDIQISINSGGSDDNELHDGVSFATVSGALDALPKFLNGKVVDIWIQEDVYENIDIKYFSSGRINLYLDGNTVYGYIRSYMSSAKTNVYGGYMKFETDRTGVIHPSTGCAVAGRTGSLVGQESASINGYSLKIYGSDNKATDGASATVGIVGDAFSTGYYKEVQFVNCDVGFRGSGGGRIHDASSNGVCSQYGYQATSGAVITITNAAHCGGTTSNTAQTLPGQIIAHGSATYEGGNQTTDTTPAPSTTTKKTVTIQSNSGDTYRSSVYNNWKKDNTARQGDYGYGDCNGCWFFGTQFNQFKGKNITKIELTIKRISGGSYAAVPIVVKTHNYASRPSGKPSYGSSCGSVSIATGSSGKLTITNSTVLNAISNGTVKGFGIQSTYNSANYAVCSGSVTMKVTYTE